MKSIDLCGQWMMQAVGSEESFCSKVPGTVAQTLLENGKIADPFWRDNEEKVLPIFDRDYLFFKDFYISPEDLDHDRVMLHCDGLDTLAEISLNGKYIAATENMHRVYCIDVKETLKTGKNRLEILFHSPTKYLQEHPTVGAKPYSVLRKAACMFGWDWGINLPDSGIWRNIYLEVFDGGKISFVKIRQTHQTQKVMLEIMPLIESWDSNVSLQIEVFDPEGKVIYSQSNLPLSRPVSISVADPQLWWPAGYGKQAMYRISVSLWRGNVCLDTTEKEIGLRTVRLSRKVQEKGSEYAFFINEKPIYIRGENLIMDDAVIGRSTDIRWRQLVENASRSHLNCLRVWGGAYYPPDIFYELCDKAGILIYQDFMFACSLYSTNEAFCENVRIEATQQVQRLGHHPSLALWCGNNEIESIFLVLRATDPASVALRNKFGGGVQVTEAVYQRIWGMYRQIFLEILPDVCNMWSPETGYVSSSPSLRVAGSGESFADHLFDGDMHYYLQYNNNAPYQLMRKMHSRFMSEIGFQSYPSIKTIAAFSKKEDQRADSPIMFAHQKCKNGNSAIEEYMRRDYVIPSDFSDYVYLSQLQAGEIMRYTVEAFRRDSAYNRGVILWQFNDCWPVVSWAGIDYYGRWKAQQYFTKRFFAPVLLTAEEEETIAILSVSNESMEDIQGEIEWYIRTNQGKAVANGTESIVAKAGKNTIGLSIELENLLEIYGKNKIYLEYLFTADGEKVSDGTTLFCVAKNYEFEQAKIHCSIREDLDRYWIDVDTDTFTKGIMLDTSIGDCIFSDNWFDLSAGHRKSVYVLKKEMNHIESLEDLKEQLQINSLNDVFYRARY